MGGFEIGLLLFGLILGPFLNFAIYAFAYFPRQISPWQSPHKDIKSRDWGTKLPVLGWFFLMRESVVFGRLHWFRPVLIEIGTPIALLFLYRYVMQGNTVPAALPADILFHHFVAYALLLSLMTVATFIDFDERTIPDWVTLPGTLFGLIGAVVVPDWRLYDLGAPVFPVLAGGAEALHANSPHVWPVDWNPGAVGAIGLWLGLFFWTGWCFGMADRRWIDRRGIKKAFVYFFAALQRNPSTRLLLGIWLAGSISITVAYWTVGPVQWEALLSSLFGMGLGGGLVWGFRLVARWAMGQEALGFGDVTLMAMIGAFFGWQIVWIAFFAAPFFGLAFVLIAWLATGDKATPFGPYLCAATASAMLFWPKVWSECGGLFQSPMLVLPILIVLLAMLGAMLWVVQMVKMKLFGEQ